MAITLNGTTGIGAPGTETFGDGTALGGATNPIVSMAKGANNYVQGYIVNNTNGTSSSADLVAYPSNGTDAHGWVDVGVTSLAYADTTYTVTGPNEAYLFGSAPSGSGSTGNLVIATDNTGTANSIQFYTGGFTQAKTAAKMTINGSGAIAYGTSYGTSGQVLTSNGSAAAPTWNTLSVNGGAATTNPMSVNVTLTSSSNKVQVLTPDAQSRRITLPDATTMGSTGGPIFVLQNTVPWYPVAVMDSAGNNIGWVVADYESRVYLTSTASATGNWVIKTGNASADAGIYPFDTPYVSLQAANGGYSLGQNYASALSTDLAMVHSSSASATTFASYSLLTQPYKQNVGVPGSNNSFGTSTYGWGYFAVVPVSATMTMYFYFDNATNQQLRCFVYSINATTGALTKGAEIVLLGGATTPFFSASTVDSTHVLVTYQNAAGNMVAQMISISGTTCTAGTATGTIIAWSTLYNQVVVLSSTLAHFTDGVKVWDLTLNTGANSVAINSSVAVPNNTVFGLAQNSSTSSMVFYKNASSVTVSAVVTSTGGTPTISAASSTLLTGDTSSYYAISTVKPGLAIALVNSGFNSASPARFALVKVSGGVPVLASTGTMPGSNTSYQVFMAFSSGLGVTPIQPMYGTTSGTFAYQKIAVAGGI